MNHEKMNNTDQKLCLAPGTTLGKNYQIIKQIGKGGMGSVYLAFDTRLDLQVAIKVISPEFSQTMEVSELEGVLKRFESEAKIAAKIDHPNVIRIFGFSRESVEIDNHRYDIDYLVMELVSGRTLRNTMDVSGFEHEEEIKSWIDKYLIPILDGLQKVHDCGIIHRDIKPENFLMKEDVPKLADFGLSMGFNLPSVTGSVADIFGTLTYMAPEQFYNFSMARETADIYSIGKILFEVVEGKISEKAKPFLQAKLSNLETEYRKVLNSVIMTATAVNPAQRFNSVHEFKEKLLQLTYCGGVNLALVSEKQAFFSKKKLIWPIALTITLIAGLLVGRLQNSFQPATQPPVMQIQEQQKLEKLGSVRYIPQSSESAQTIRAKDKSILHFIPPTELELADKNLLGQANITVKPFYLSETPVTNQQYVAFLNENITRVKVVESDVYLDELLVLKISERIRNYKPITFEGGRFTIKDPMHSACAVLVVTGMGAEAYARFYNLRLPYAQEWVSVKITSKDNSAVQRQPIPVINYEQDQNGLRGIDQVAEWGKINEKEFGIFGHAASSMLEHGFVLQMASSKAFPDTSFRVAMDVN
jgi:serine/threonine-protein kinase